VPASASALVELIDRSLREHAWSHFWFVVLTLKLCFEIVGWITDEAGPEEFTVGWATVAFVGCSGVGALLIARVRTPRKALVRWGVALTPFIVAAAAHLTGAPGAVMWWGWGVSIILCAWAAMTTRDKRQPEG
jgi:hypothetical protein